MVHMWWTTWRVALGVRVMELGCITNSRAIPSKVIGGISIDIGKLNKLVYYRIDSR